MAKRTKDSDGIEVADGDFISFAYGLPPRAVVAKVVERNGHLIALTPNETPRECRLDQLQQLVGGFYKTKPKPPDTREVEARLFWRRQARSEGEQP